MPAMIEEAGLWELDATDYHADPCPFPSLNNTTVGVLLDRCARAAWHQHPRLNPTPPPPEKNKRLDLGTVAHEMLLGKGRGFHIIDADSYRSQRSQLERDAAISVGRTPILVDQHNTARAMVKAAREQLPEFEGGEHAFNQNFGVVEIGLFWKDPTGPWGRSLIDFYGHKLKVVECWDYKTTDESARPEGLGTRFANYGYETQAAIQERGLVVVRPELAGRLRFRYLFQETAPPYLISVVEPDDAAMLCGRKDVSLAFQLWARCLKTNAWPGYPKNIARIRYPAGAEARCLERELQNELLLQQGKDPFMVNAQWTAPGGAAAEASPRKNKKRSANTLHNRRKPKPSKPISDFGGG